MHEIKQEFSSEILGISMQTHGLHLFVYHSARKEKHILNIEFPNI